MGNKVSMGGNVYDTNFKSMCQKLKVRVVIVSYGSRNRAFEKKEKNDYRCKYYGHHTCVPLV